MKAFIRLFTREGFEVESTSNISDAYERIKKVPYDCVIMSINSSDYLGEHDFLVYTKKVSPKATAVVISEFPQIDKTMNLIGYGADGVFVKPVKINLLIDAVKGNINPN